MCLKFYSFTFLCVFSLNILGCAKNFQQDNTRPDMSPYSKQFNSVVVFGDSLSDNGNINFLTRGLSDLGLSKVYPENPYSKGMFSNKEVWIEMLMNNLNLNSRSSQDCFFSVVMNHSCNYAIGGATTAENITADNDPFQKIKELFQDSKIINYLSNMKIPMRLGVKEMIKSYLEKDKPDDYALNHTLYVIWAGSNDYLYNSNAETTVTNLIDSIKLILDHSPQSSEKRYFLIPNLPDMGNTPYARKKPEKYQKELQEKSNLHNKLLKEKIKQLKNDPIYKVKAVIIELDIEKFYKDVTNNTQGNSPFKNITESCYTKNYMELDGEVCQIPRDYLFWDEVHPTQHAHCLIAKLALQNLLQENLVHSVSTEKICENL